MNQFSSNYFVFFLSPFLALANSLLRWRETYAKNIVWFFTCFYGVAFYMHPDIGSDCVRYREWFESLHAGEMSFETLKSSFFQEGERYYDLYQPLVSFGLSRFTGDFRILFGIFGFVLGFFYSRVIFFFLDSLPGKLPTLAFPLAIALAFALNIGSAINGVRMYTASYVFLFGFLYYWRTYRVIYLLVAASAALVHFSFLMPLTILVGLPAIRSFPTLCYLFFVISFIATAVDVSAIRSIVESLPLGLESRVGGYLNEMDPDSTEIPRILILNRWAMRLVSLATLSYFFTLIRRRILAPEFYSSVIFSMLLYGTVNVLAEVGSIGRFYYLCDILNLGTLLVLVCNFGFLPRIQELGWLVACLSAINTLLGIRFFLGFSSMHLLVGNPVTIWFLDFADRSLYDYLPRIISGA